MVVVSGLEKDGCCQWLREGSLLSVAWRRTVIVSGLEKDGCQWLREGWLLSVA